MDSEPKPSQTPPSLYTHEWFAVLSMISIMVVLTIVSQYHAAPQVSEPPHYIVESEIEVFVQGAVYDPGYYKIKSGTLLKGLLEKVKLLPEADISKLQLEKRLKRSQKIKIPHKKTSRAAGKPLTENVP